MICILFLHMPGVSSVSGVVFDLQVEWEDICKRYSDAKVSTWMSEWQLLELDFCTWPWFVLIVFIGAKLYGYINID